MNNSALYIQADAGGIGMDSSTAGVRIVGDPFSNNPVASIGYYTGNVVSHANWTNILMVKQGGNVGIGTTSPSYKLHVAGDIYSSGTITEASSITLKENLNPITDALDIISSLQGWTYDRKDGSAMNQAGFIAEEVEQVLPNVVSKDKDGAPMGVQYTKIIAYLVESVKELKAQIEHLKK